MNFWKMAYDNKWCSKATLEEAKSEGLITKAEYNEILGIVPSAPKPAAPQPASTASADVKPVEPQHSSIAVDPKPEVKPTVKPVITSGPVQG